MAGEAGKTLGYRLLVDSDTLHGCSRTLPHGKALKKV